MILAFSLRGSDAIDYMYNHRLSPEQAERLTDGQRFTLACAIAGERRRVEGEGSSEKAAALLADVLVLAPIIGEDNEDEFIDALVQALGGSPDSGGAIMGVDTRTDCRDNAGSGDRGTS